MTKEELSYEERKIKYKFPYDEKLVDMFKGKKRWSNKLKEIVRFTLDSLDDDNNDFRDFLGDYMNENHYYALMSFEYQENIGLEKVFTSYNISPDDVAEMIKTFINESEKTLEEIKLFIQRKLSYKNYDKYVTEIEIIKNPNLDDWRYKNKKCMILWTNDLNPIFDKDLSGEIRKFLDKYEYEIIKRFKDKYLISFQYYPY